MSLWRRKRPAWPVRPEGISDEQWLAQLFDQLADDIADDGDEYSWSSELRKSADWVRAGSPTGLHRFFKLADPDPRNTFNEQLFTTTGTYFEASRLASQLLQEHRRSERRYSIEAKSALRPWTKGGPGKAVIYEDGTVVATEDDAGGDPHIADIEAASRPDEHPIATLAIRADGSCVRYRYRGDERWLADRLHEHHPELHLEPQPPGFGRP
jgi:hypothetical protein